MAAVAAGGLIDRHGGAGWDGGIMGNMRNWTEIGFSSIYYVLNRLEGRGFIKSSRQASIAGKPARRIYTITAAGRQIFKKKIRTLLSEYQRTISPFELGITFCSVLSPRELKACLKSHTTPLERHLEWVQGCRTYSKQNQRPSGVRAKFDRLAVLARTEHQWLGSFLKTL